MKTCNFKLYIGTNDETVAYSALADDPSAYLINVNNLNIIHSGVGYTSVPDCESDGNPDKNLATLCRAADVIVYSPPPHWATTDRTHKKFFATEQYWVERCILNFTLDRNKQIINCPPNTVWDSISAENIQTITALADTRKTDSQQLWAVGCSFTYAVGVSIEERYATLLSKQTNLPLSLLARPGTSIPWARDQILRSDIRKDDLVIWGLTSWHRFTYYDRKKNNCEHIHVGYYTWFPAFNKQVPLDYLDSPTLLYESICAIEQVVNFCNKIGAKLILAGLLLDPDIAEYLKNKFTNYIHLIHFWGDGQRTPDISPNDCHPGIISHNYYATNILNLAKELKYI